MFGGRRTVILALLAAVLATVAVPLAVTDLSDAADTSIIYDDSTVTVHVS